MHQYKKGLRKLGITLLTTIFLFSAIPVFAQNQVPKIGTQGQIDFISLRQGLIVVMDMERRLAPGYVVVDKKGKRISAFNLKQGVPVQLQLNDSGQVIRITVMK